MADEIELPQLIVKNTKSQFRLRCHAASWAAEYGGRMKLARRYSQESPGLLLLSATGPDTAVNSVRASLYQPDVEVEFVLENENTSTRMLKARSLFDGKPVVYKATLARLAPGVIHLIALAKIPGLMPDISNDQLWIELTSSRYTTPLLRSWVPWLKQTMSQGGGIVLGDGFAASAGVLRTEPDELDALVSLGVKEGHLHLVA